jgi:integrase
MGPSESLWPSPAATNGEGLRSATFYGRFRKYLRQAGLPPAGLHILRHSAAKLRRDAGESIEDVSRFLDHSSLAVTSTYLRRLEGQEDLGWGKVAEAIGLSSFDPARMRAYASVQGGDYPHSGTERV